MNDRKPPFDLRGELDLMVDRYTVIFTMRPHFTIKLANKIDRYILNKVMKENGFKYYTIKPLKWCENRFNKRKWKIIRKATK